MVGEVDAGTHNDRVIANMTAVVEANFATRLMNCVPFPPAVRDTARKGALTDAEAIATVRIAPV